MLVPPSIERFCAAKIVQNFPLGSDASLVEEFFSLLFFVFDVL